MYPIAYVLILVGIIIYNIREAPEPKFKPILKDQQSEQDIEQDIEQETKERAARAGDNSTMV